MAPALLIRLRPAGPWRYGPGDGAHDRVDSLFRSDRLYSALCHAMLQFGFLPEWLAATAESTEPAVVVSSLFPFQGDTLFAPPPETMWPPALSTLRTPSPVFLTKVRWRAARFVPVSLIEALLTGTPVQADQWIADAESGCLLRRDRPQSSPFRLTVRARVPVDRVSGTSAEPHKSACVEFEPGAGLWTVVRFSNSEAASAWKDRLTAAFRFLCDSGFGGSRSAGWGQAAPPEITEGNWPALLLPKLAKIRQPAEVLSPLHWLLSVYSPADADSVEWSQGRYSLILRGGRVESRTGSGAEKKTVRMVSEGSVLCSEKPVHGRAIDVAPDGFAHPVYRAGFALALQLPVIHIVETPEPEPVVSEMDATLAAALAAAEEERAAAETTTPVVTPEAAGAPETADAAHDLATEEVPVEPAEAPALPTSQVVLPETMAPEAVAHEAAAPAEPQPDQTLEADESVAALPPPEPEETSELPATEPVHESIPEPPQPAAADDVPSTPPEAPPTASPVEESVEAAADQTPGEDPAKPKDSDNAI